MEATDLDAILEQMKARIRDGSEPGYDGSAVATLDKPGVRKRILSMIRVLHALAGRREESMLADLGIHPLWLERHEEVEQVIQRVAPA